MSQYGYKWRILGEPQAIPEFSALRYIRTYSVLLLPFNILLLVLAVFTLLLCLRCLRRLRQHVRGLFLFVLNCLGNCYFNCLGIKFDSCWHGPAAKQDVHSLVSSFAFFFGFVFVCNLERVLSLSSRKTIITRRCDRKIVYLSGHFSSPKSSCRALFGLCFLQIAQNHPYTAVWV